MLASTHLKASNWKKIKDLQLEQKQEHRKGICLLFLETISSGLKKVRLYNCMDKTNK